MSLYLKDLSCELCSAALPSFITYQSQKISLLSLTYPTKNYIILEEYRPDRLLKQGLHIISLDENQFGTIGRGHDCDIKISDISVSRKHSKVRMHNNEFFIEDTKSKFGTLEKINSSFIIRKNTDITLQMNRTVIRLIHKQPLSLNSLCCCVSNNKIANDCSSYLNQTEFYNQHEPYSDRVTMNIHNN